VPKRNTEGRRLLAAWLKGAGRSQTALAHLLRINQAMISAWASGSCRPEAHHREALEHLTGIPARAWQTPAERAYVRRARELGAALGGRPATQAARLPRRAPRGRVAPTSRRTARGAA
jgi:transcriptional regulator with XRE-family HTH domain